MIEQQSKSLLDVILKQLAEETAYEFYYKYQDQKDEKSSNLCPIFE